MRIHRLLALPVAVAFACAATVSVAQDKPSSGSAAKPKTGTTSAAKHKPWANTPPLNSSTSKSVAEPAGTRPAATQVAPMDERNYKSCHSKESDA